MNTSKESFPMKTVILLFSHNTFARRWQALAMDFATEGIELIALSQSSTINWTQFGNEQLQRASVLYVETTSGFAGLGDLAKTSEALPFVVAGSMDAAAELENPHPAVAERFQSYLACAEREDLANGVRYLLFAAGHEKDEPPQPGEPVLCAVAHPDPPKLYQSIDAYLAGRAQSNPDQRSALVPLLYGRRYWTSDDLPLIVALMNRLSEDGFEPVPVFCDFTLGNRLNDPDHPVARLLRPHFGQIVALLNLAFSNASGEASPDRLFREIGRPVLQLVRDYSRTEAEWLKGKDSLTGMTYNFSIAQPEILGTIEPHLIACNDDEKDNETNDPTPRALPVVERVTRLVRRLHRWHRLQTLPNKEKRLCLMLNNAPCKGVEATLGCAAGLDAAQSAIDLMNRLKNEGYAIQDIPKDGEALLSLIRERKAHSEFRWTNTTSIVTKGGVLEWIDGGTYFSRFNQLDEDLRTSINEAWGPFPGKSMVHPNAAGEESLLITGISFGNVTLMIEPKRGCWGPKCDGEVCRILHQPDIPPTHHWLATAWYIQEKFDAIIHMGAEGALDYLPGKQAALGPRCFPDISLGELPRLHPYIMDSIGEGLLAKRRGKAVILSHLTAPAKSLGSDAHYGESILELHRQLLHAQDNNQTSRAAELRTSLLREMTENGLLDAETEEAEQDEAIRMLPRRLQRMRARSVEAGKHILGRIPDDSLMCLYAKEAEDAFDPSLLRDKLSRTTEETDRLIAGLEGRFVPSGQAGALSSGREDLLPTGRNFYGIDLRIIPTQAAWSIGSKLGAQLLRRHLQNENRFPESIGITLWSSDAFVAEGELTAQCLWLLGCKPVWNAQGRVTGIEVMPCEAMVFPMPDGSTVLRPRIDVVVRMSGVVRDLLEPVYLLIDDAVAAVSRLKESPDFNFVRKHVEARLAELENRLPELDNGALRRLATGRLFTDRTGSYGSGVGLAIDASAWKSEKDLADTFINWTGGLCGRGMNSIVSKVGKGAVMREFGQQMRGIEIAYQRAISSKYDALSISCYTGYQGGMAVTRKALKGEAPRLYWGDSESGPEGEVRPLAEELDMALTSRLLSPAWLEGKMDEGYGGAADLSTLVNTLFAWSATTGEVRKRHFDLVTRRLVEDPAVRNWFLKQNPHALEEITRRLLEAQGRKLWAADAESMAGLQDVALQVEGTIEEALGPVDGDFQGSSVDIKTEDTVGEWKWEVRIDGQEVKD